MFRNFNPSLSWWPPRDPKTAARVVLGSLLGLNLIAAFFIVRPPGGSPESLEEQSIALRSQIQQRRQQIQRERVVAAKLDTGRVEGDKFLNAYFLSRRSAYSTIVFELYEMAKKAGVKPKEQAFSAEMVEGSDDLIMLTVTCNYEGTYRDVVNFVNQLDKTNRFIIVESLQATPQQSSQLLNVSLKLNTFVRDDGSNAPIAPPPTPDEENATRKVASAAGGPQ